jgi:hypothetical protein
MVGEEVCMLGASQGWCVCLLIQQNYRYLTSSIAYTSSKTLAMASLRPRAGTPIPLIPPFFPASLLVLLITPPPFALPIVLRNDIPITKPGLPHALRPALIALHSRSRNHHVQRTPVRVRWQRRALSARVTGCVKWPQSQGP